MTTNPSKPTTPKGAKMKKPATAATAATRNRHPEQTNRRTHMKRHTALAIIIALTASLMFGGAAEAQAVTPLNEEPVALSVDGSQHIFDHAVTPATCSIIVDRVGTASCFELITDWVCPSGNGTNPLSADALGRFSPTYNGLIANPVTPRAYVDTHCLLVGTRPQPVPAATISCKAGEVVAMNSAGGLVCAATPTVAVPSFTG